MQANRVAHPTLFKVSSGKVILSIIIIMGPGYSCSLINMHVCVFRFFEFADGQKGVWIPPFNFHGSMIIAGGVIFLYSIRVTKS